MAQPLEAKLIDLSKGTLFIQNRRDFKNLEDIRLEWQLEEDGQIIDQGQFDELEVGPGESTQLNLQLNKPKFQTGQEIYLTFFYFLKKTVIGLKKDIRSGGIRSEFEIGKNPYLLKNLGFKKIKFN